MKILLLLLVGVFSVQDGWASGREGDQHRSDVSVVWFCKNPPITQSGDCMDLGLRAMAKHECGKVDRKKIDCRMMQTMWGCGVPTPNCYSSDDKCGRDTITVSTKGKFQVSICKKAPKKPGFFDRLMGKDKEGAGSAK